MTAGHPRNPFLTVDGLIRIGGGIVLIERRNPPPGWALPGGFVDYGETVEDACVRECREETGLEVTLVRQFHTYSDPRRDPRHHTVCVVFLCDATGEPKADDDAKNAGIFTREQIAQLTLAFDHRQILEDYFGGKY